MGDKINTIEEWGEKIAREMWQVAWDSCVAFNRPGGQDLYDDPVKEVLDNVGPPPGFIAGGEVEKEALKRVHKAIYVLHYIAAGMPMVRAEAELEESLRHYRNIIVAAVKSGIEKTYCPKCGKTNDGSIACGDKFHTYYEYTDTELKQAQTLYSAYVGGLGRPKVMNEFLNNVDGWVAAVRCAREGM